MQRHTITAWTAGTIAAAAAFTAGLALPAQSASHTHQVCTRALDKDHAVHQLVNQWSNQAAEAVTAAHAHRETRLRELTVELTLTRAELAKASAVSKRAAQACRASR